MQMDLMWGNHTQCQRELIPDIQLPSLHSSRSQDLSPEFQRTYDKPLSSASRPSIARLIFADPRLISRAPESSDPILADQGGGSAAMQRTFCWGEGLLYSSTNEDNLEHSGATVCWGRPEWLVDLRSHVGCDDARQSINASGFILMHHKSFVDDHRPVYQRQSIPNATPSQLS